MKRLQMKNHDTSGVLITFAGLDGCGKSTMIEMLEDKLQETNRCYLLTKQPTHFVRETDIFRTYMDEPDHSAYDYRALSLLCAADRIQHTNKVILPALRSGRVVISDRYFHCCHANLRARGLRQDKWIYEIARHIIRPDAAFMLDVPVETAVERVRARASEKERYIDMPLQYRLREEHINTAKVSGGIILSSIGEKEATFEIIWEKLQSILEENKNGYQEKSVENC